MHFFVLACALIPLQSDVPLRQRAKTYHGAEPSSLAQWATWNRYHNDTDVIFSPAWSDYNGGQPHFTKNLPDDMKPWSPWFRNRLRDGQQILSTAEICRVREFVERYVRWDTRADYPVGEKGAPLVARLREVCRDAVRHAGISEPSSELMQILAVYTCVQFVEFRAIYDLKALRGDGVTPRTVSYGWQGDLVGQYLERKPIPVVCEEASNLMQVLVKEWVKQEKLSGMDFPVEVLQVSGTPGWILTDGHAWNGVTVKSSDGKMMKYFCDATPSASASREKYVIRQSDITGGTLSRAGLELFLAKYRPVHVDLMYQDVIGLRKGEQISNLKADGGGYGFKIDSLHLRPEERFWTGVPVEHDWRNDRENQRLWRDDVQRLAPDLKRLRDCYNRMGRA